MQHDNGALRELLPFSVSIAREEEALLAAVRVRQAAYARHLPDVAKTMVHAEAWDFAPGTVVLVARSKLDGSPLGTMRLHTNEHAGLPLEQSFDLPNEFSGLSLVEATRFALNPTAASPVVKMALLKASVLYAQKVGAARMVITARAPLDRMYQRLLFTDVDANAGFVPMRHVGGLPHRIMWQGVADAKGNMRAAQHPLYEFLYEITHPDIDIVVPSASRQRACQVRDLAEALTA